MTATKIASASNQIDWNALREIYEQGGSDIEIANELRISMREFLKMEKEIPNFSRFVELGRTMSQAWWYSRGRKNLANKEFNTALYNFNMKNRYGWADKVETSTNPSDDTLNADQMKSEIARLAKKLGKTHPELLHSLVGEDSE